MRLENKSGHPFCLPPSLLFPVPTLLWLPGSTFPLWTNAPTCRPGPGLDQNKDLKQKGKGHNFRNHSPAGDSPRPHMPAFPDGDLRAIEVERQVQGHTVSGALAYLWKHLECIFRFPVSRNSEGPSLIFLSSCGSYMALLSLAFIVFLLLPWLHCLENK